MSSRFCLGHTQSFWGDIAPISIPAPKSNIGSTGARLLTYGGSLEASRMTKGWWAEWKRGQLLRGQIG